MTRIRTLVANWASRLAQRELLTALPGSRAGSFRSRRGRSGPRRARRTLSLEALEDRTVPSPVVLDPSLGVQTVVSGLTQPTSMVFLGSNDFFVTEKTTGKIDHVINGVNSPTQFNMGAGPIGNLPVNNNSERGLLGIALSPNFASDHAVYLYWTESSTGSVSNDVGAVPVLGNRVDRFIWTPDNNTLTFDKNIIRLHAFQQDGNNGQPTGMQGNHNGGVIKFGPDGKLYIVIGDNGRRGWLQNLINGPNGPGQTDENNGPVRGGPSPDDAHLTGTLLRLNPDGSTPDDNPFSDIRNTLGSGPNPNTPLLTALPGTHSFGTGSFTAFLNQAEDTLTVIITERGLTSATLDGGADIRFGGTDGPSILNVSDFPGGVASGQFTTTLTAANFTPDPADGINTFADAINAVLNGQTSFTISTVQNPNGEIGGQVSQLDPSVTANIHKIFAYGIRNSFGFGFDPVTGRLWLEENGDQSFDKISIIDAGANDGWIQSSAPLVQNDGSLDPGALAEFKAVELQRDPVAMQQIRWPTANIPDTPEQALSQLVMLPGAHYNPPVFSVRAELPPAGLGFLNSSALGPQYQNALFEGEARDNFVGSPFRDAREQFDGALFVFHPNANRSGLDFGGDPNIRTTDNVFQNNADFDVMGDTSFLLGTNFGVLTDIETGPDGNLYVVSLSGGAANIGGAVFKIFSKDAAAAFQQTNLVSDIAAPPGGAPEIVDTNLKNPWGISLSSGSPFWVANQRTGTSTVYSGDVTQPDGTIRPIAVARAPVTVPTPTGTVFNNTTDFKLANGNPASFIFDGLNGTMSAWNAGDVNTAEVKATVMGASYTGLAIGTNSAGKNFLYAANQATGKIDVFDANFQLTTLGPGGNFEDPNLPPGSPFKAFNIQKLGGTLYVAYDKMVTVNGVTDREHDGIVDAFNTDGQFLRRVVTGGVNAPWGLALAPDNFGPFSNDLLVGNFGFGDGKINAYDPNTGQFVGNLTDANGNPIAIEGLWGLTFGNGGSGGDPNALYFAAGINRTGANSFGAADGLFGSIRFAGFGVQSSAGVEPGPVPASPATVGGPMPSRLSIVRGIISAAQPSAEDTPADPPSANLVAALLKAGSPDLASTPDASGMITSDSQIGTLRNHSLTDQVFLAAKKDGLSLLSSTWGA